jgi:hypothetical protein
MPPSLPNFPQLGLKGKERRGEKKGKELKEEVEGNDVLPTQW